MHCKETQKKKAPQKNKYPNRSVRACKKKITKEIGRWIYCYFVISETNARVKLNIFCYQTHSK